MSDRRYYFSGSTYSLARKCPASMVLPRSNWGSSPAADMGSAIHEHLSDRVQFGVDEAFARIYDTAKRWNLDEDAERIFEARCRSFKFTPPPGAIAEFPLALLGNGDVATCVGARGEYAVPDGAIMPLTLDAMWSEPQPLDMSTGLPRCPEGSVLFVVDYKTGSDENIDAIEENRQLNAAALLAARYTDAALVLPAVILVRAGDGVWDTLTAPAKIDDLAWVEAEIHATDRKCSAELAKLEAGKPLKLVEGTHCLYCPARDRCPAKVAMVRDVLGSESPDLAVPLSTADRARLATMLPQIVRWADKAKSLLKADVEANGPIDLGDGRVWGPHVVLRDELDPNVGLPLLVDEIGDTHAQSALTITLTKGGIEDAVKAAHAEAGIKRQVSPTIRRVLARMHDAGGIQKVSKVYWETHKARPEIEATTTEDAPTAEQPKEPT